MITISGCYNPQQGIHNSTNIEVVKETEHGTSIEKFDTLDQYWISKQQSVKLIKSHEEAKLPFKASIGAACSDLYSVETTEIQPGETKLLSTGLKVAHIPTGHRLSIFDRSGFRAKGIFGSSVGIIDEDYRGELKVILYNSTKNPVQIKSGDRIAQMCLEVVQPVSYSFTETFEETERGEGGFGSTN